MKIVGLVFVSLIVACGSTDTGPNCTVGKRCGNTCISRDKVCRQDVEPLEDARAGHVAPAR